MAVSGSKQNILVTVRTYPVPATKGVEVSCTAGVTRDGQWIRLFPIPYRSLDEDRRFTKYQWIEAEVRKARNDQRPESFVPNLDTITIKERVSAADQWRARKDIIKTLVRSSLCGIQREQQVHGYPTLGIFKPAEIRRLVIEPEEHPDWTPLELSKLNQTLSMFDRTPAGQLEKLPFKFKYDFRCADTACNGHLLSCTDWEIGQSYRKWRREYGDGWEQAFRQRYERDMIEKYDTHFFVGNLHQYPNSWLIVGLFYPPPQSTPDLFD